MFIINIHLFIVKGYAGSRTSTLDSFLTKRILLKIAMHFYQFQCGTISFGGYLSHPVALKWLTEPCILTGYFSVQLLFKGNIQIYFHINISGYSFGNSISVVHFACLVSY